MFKITTKGIQVSQMASETAWLCQFAYPNLTKKEFSSNIKNTSVLQVTGLIFQ